MRDGCKFDWLPVGEIDDQTGRDRSESELMHTRIFAYVADAA